MRKLTLALLGGASICLAFTVALLIWRAGGGMAAAAAGLASGLALALSLQGMVGRLRSQAEVAREMSLVRDAQLAIAAALEQINAKLEGLTSAVEVGAERTSQELTSEVRMLEDLVQRMSHSLDERGASTGMMATPSVRRDDPQSAALLATVREALAQNRVDLYLQPVVSLPQRRTVFYEGFSRLRDESGRVLMPAQYLSVAEPEGLVTAIDNLLLFRCVQIVRRLARQDRKVGIFCNISLTSLRDEVFFPQFLDFLAENKDMSGGLIFEIGQAAFEARGPVEARNMAKLADLGFDFSIDKINNLDLDFRELQRADVKYLKISAQVMLENLAGADGDASMPFRDIHAADFAGLARRYGAEVIAEKVEAERQVIDVLELDIAYGQGHLFGEPRAIKDSILAETDPPVEVMRASLRRRSARA
ncbi:MAG: flagella assembly cyclic-di-GMP phosphodiesterase TipF [Caulobacteraceae bacterium]